MAAFVFPLVVKRMLESEGYYSLTNDDKGRCHAIDKLLAVAQWGLKGGEEFNGAMKWRTVLRATLDDLLWERIKEKLADQSATAPNPDDPS